MDSGVQFITDGPLIPNELIKSHQEGNLVIFCGAGISYRLGLKDFEGLTRDLYGRLNAGEELENDNEIKEEFKKGNYERVLGLLEDRREERFRSELKEWGQIKTEVLNYSTHEAIINLSFDQDKKFRLVTTNFDLGFYNLIEKKYKEIKIDSAPKLPVPKKSKWTDSLVHLHGIATDEANIVITSADFGAGYITERWASRFVSELFYSFDILFIGYSLSDPVLRYLNDAIASDVKKKFAKTKRFAFVKAGEKAIWERKKIIPIEFKDDDDYKSLHETIKIWEKKYSEGSLGFSKLCYRLYRLPPKTGDPDTEYIINELFNNREVAAKLFVGKFETENGQEIIKYPLAEWWEHILEKEKKILKENDQKFLSCLVYSHTETPQQLEKFHDKYIFWFIDLMKQDNDNDDMLKKWVVEKGSVLHPKLIKIIYLKYNELSEKLSSEDKKFWDFLIFNRDFLISSLDISSISFYNFEKNINAQIIISIFKFFSTIEYKMYYSKQDFNAHFNAHLDLEYHSLSNHNQPVIKYIESCRDINELKKIFNHLKNELQKITDCKEYWGKKDEDFDLFGPALRSLTPHEQNGNIYEKPNLYLILCLATCFESLSKSLSKRDPGEAHNLGIFYSTSPISIHKRLYLHFLKFKNVFSIKEVQDYLEKPFNNSIWFSDCKREWFRLIDERWDELPGGFKGSIFSKILESRKFLYKKKPDSHDRERYRDGAIGDILSWFEGHDKLNHDPAIKELARIKEENPEIKFKRGERVEFTSWISTGVYGIKKVSLSKLYKINDPPKIITKLKKIIKTIASREEKTFKRPYYNLNFSEWMLSEYSKNLLKAMKYLAGKEGEDEIKIIGYFFRDIAFNKKIIISSYTDIIAIIRSCSDSQIKECHRNVSCFLRNAIEEEIISLTKIIDIWEKLFNIAKDDDEDITEDEDIIHASINSSIGNLYWALFIDFFSETKNKDSGLNQQIKSAWNKIRKIKDDKKKNLAYVQYGQYLGNISFVDFKWLEENIYPVIKEKSQTSFAIWNGFLAYSRIDHRLMELIKPEFLSLYNDFSKTDYLKNYLSLIVYLSINPPVIISPEKFRKILRKLNLDQKVIMLQELVRQIKGISDEKNSNDKKNAFWKNSLRPWIEKYWPTSDEFKHERFNEIWLECLLEVPNPADEDFELIKKLLVPGIEFGQLYFLRLDKTIETISSYPKYLDIFSILISEKLDRFTAEGILKIIKKMQEKHPQIINNENYKKIREKIIQAGVDFP